MPTTISLDRARLRHVAALAEALVASGDYASAVVAVADRRAILWQHAVSGRSAVTPDSIFPIASITKGIITTAIMQLVERGLLLLGDPVAAYVPEFGQYGKDSVTIRHLLTHTSGLDEGSADAAAALHALGERHAPRAAFYDLACGLGLEHPPGERAVYRQLPFTVLAELLTRLGGRDYPDWLRDELFTPLGMADTGFAPADPARLAPHPGPAQPDDAWDYRYGLAIPAYGLYSTAADLAAFGQALLGGGRRGAARILSAGAVAAMTTPQPDLLSDDGSGTRPVFAGLTWGMRSPFGNLIGSARGFGHAGGTGSWLWIDPDWDLVFVLLSNSDGPPQSLAMRLLNATYGALDRADTGV